MAGFANDANNKDIMFADNVDFSGGATPAGQFTTNGQLLIGATAFPNIRIGSLTSTGGTITITTGPGTINLENASAFSFVDTSGTFNAAKSTGYFLTDTSNATLPPAPGQGAVVIFVADTANPVVITANAGQSIRFGNAISSVAGTWTNSAQGDSLTMYFRLADLTWIVTSSIGTWVPS